MQLKLGSGQGEQIVLVLQNHPENINMEHVVATTYLPEFDYKEG